MTQLLIHFTARSGGKAFGAAQEVTARTLDDWFSTLCSGFPLLARRLPREGRDKPDRALLQLARFEYFGEGESPCLLCEAACPPAPIPVIAAAFRK